MFLLLAASFALAADTCPAGQSITQDSLGHCCWDGQAWNGSACAGLPLSCPQGHRVQVWSQSCVTTACPDGQENIDGLHCCWPAQTWDSSAESCVGTPQCPAGYGPLGDTSCVQGGAIGGLIGAKGSYRPSVDPARAGDCPSGQQLAADNLHCCLPGDAWSSTRGRCVTPASFGSSATVSAEASGTPSFGSGGGGTTSLGGDPVILGALDRSLIDAVIKRNMAQIRYCYQRELTKNPALEGKITVKFVIAKDGTVSQATTKSTTMNNANVESCINSRFMRMQFPEPKGGGIVIVSYPFVFSPG